MIIKVCGIKTLENINDLSPIIDMVGLNFYKPSIRYVDQKSEAYDNLPKGVKRVGVFVNENLEKIKRRVEDYKLDYIQLHGDESYEFGLKAATISKVIKVFRISEAKDFESIDYHHYQDYNLLDYHSSDFGGAGKKFDWQMLSNYHSKTPFLLSGGIGPKDLSAINSILHHKLMGIDINSKFESKPGVKDMCLVSDFANSIKNYSLN